MMLTEEEAECYHRRAAGIKITEMHVVEEKEDGMVVMNTTVMMFVMGKSVVTMRMMSIVVIQRNDWIIRKKNVVVGVVGNGRAKDNLATSK